MSTKSIALRILMVAIVLGLLAAVVWLLLNAGIIPPVVSLSVVYALLAAAGILLIVYSISGPILKSLLPNYGRKAYAIMSLIKIFAYVIAGIVLLTSLGLSPEVALAGGTFSGLIIGLAVQPVLSNFFSGLLVLLTGYVKPGDDVRLVTTEIPYQWAFLPGYKYFSPDYVFVGYRGRIIEVGLLYTLMVSDSGVELKIPNRIIFNATIVNYTPETQLERVLQVRYEFKVEYDPDLVLERIRNVLSDMEEIEDITINEQSDKEYYIVQIRFLTPVGKDWRAIKSEILKRLIKVHRELKLIEKTTT
ncbi:MAG: mechanosensitive ion channel family protein [Thaumarchaeota archaeon]|jgi:small-conductance mechanosensitive channel|nr:mechanosensitive ion channel family protein [Candidatus Terraquivivens yellowstonensis]